MSCSEYSTETAYIDDIRLGGHANARAGDCLYRKYRDEVLRQIKSYLRYRAGIEDDAHDAMQDAFLVMVEKIRNGGYKEGSLLHFWIGITKGLLRNKLKRDSRLELVEDNKRFDQADHQSPEWLMMSEEQRVALHGALDRLGERCRQVLLMWAGGYSMEEIAEALGLSSEGMARKTKYHCKNQLMELLDGSLTDL